MTIRTARERRRRRDTRKANQRAENARAKLARERAALPPATYLFVDYDGAIVRDAQAYTEEGRRRLPTKALRNANFVIAVRANGDAFVIKNREGRDGEKLVGDAIEARLQEVSARVKAARASAEAPLQKVDLWHPASGTYRASEPVMNGGVECLGEGCPDCARLAKNG